MGPEVPREPRATTTATDRRCGLGLGLVHGTMVAGNPPARQGGVLAWPSCGYVKGPRQPKGWRGLENGPGSRGSRTRPSNLSGRPLLEGEPGRDANHARQLVVVHLQEARVLTGCVRRGREVDEAGVEVGLAELDRRALQLGHELVDRRLLIEQVQDVH